MSEENGRELPRGWITTTIENLFAPLNDGRTLHQGWSPQCESEPRRTADEWGVLKTTAIQPGAFLPEHNKRLPAELQPRPQVEVKVGDLLITCAGPRTRCGIACLVRSTRPRLMMSGKMYRFRVLDEFVDPRYIEAFLQTPTARNAIDQMKTGGSDSGLNLTHERFRCLEVPLAPISEQQRIVDVYEELTSDLDAGVAALEHARTALNAYRASVLTAAVDGTLTAEWREEHPYLEPTSALLDHILAERRRRWEEERLAKFKAKGPPPPKNWKAKYKAPLGATAGVLPVLPKGWSWATFDQVMWRLRSGSAESSGRTATDYPVLRSSAVRHGAVDFADLNYLQREQSGNVDNFLRRGDFLITRLSGSVAYVGCTAWISQLPHDGIQYPDRIICAKLVPGAHGEYLTYSFQHPRIRKALETAAKSTAGHQRISLSDLRLLPIPLPPVAEQQAIVEIVAEQLSVIDHLEADLDAKLKSAQSLRQSILRQAFTGELVPQDPRDEPASELLKRIAAGRTSREAASPRRNGQRVRSVV